MKIINIVSGCLFSRFSSRALLNLLLSVISLVLLAACGAQENDADNRYKSSAVKPLAHIDKLTDGIIVTLASSDKSEANNIRLQVINDNVIRVTSIPHSDFLMVKDHLNKQEKAVKATFELIQKADLVLIKTAKTTAQVSLIDGKVLFKNSYDETVLSEANHSFSQEHQAQGAAKVNSYAIRQNWHQGTEEEFLIIEPQHKKTPNNKVELTSKLEMDEPFIISTRNYGVLWHNRSTIKLAKTENTPGFFKLQVNHGISPGEQYGLSFFSPLASAIDYFFIAGENTNEVLASYHQLTEKKAKDIHLYMGDALTPWQVLFKNPEQELALNGTMAELTDGTVRLTKSDKNSKADALTFNYQNTWFSSLTFAGGKPLNLSEYIEQGVVSFDIKIDDIKNSALDLVINCGDNCNSKVRLREWAINKEAQGWQQLIIPLQCFNQSGADFSKVAQPFSLEAGGKGQLAIANIQFKNQGQGNFNCPDLDKLSILPEMLNEYWAVDWWLPRHQEKVALAKQGNIDLLMIGDSITHGWENEGLTIWQQYFSDINTLNIGFGGDRTENVLWRLAHDTVTGISPKLAVIMIGTNNTGHRFEKPQNIANGVQAIVQQLKRRLPKTKILLLAIFPRGATAKDKLRINNEQANNLLAQVAQAEQILFADFNAKFLTEDGELLTTVMPDLLHPNAKGYDIWAQSLLPYFNQYLK